MGERNAEQLKHLEFVQANISRMHDASMSMKRFAIVALALGGSFSRYLQEPAILGFTMAAVIAFWMLDSKYLQVERSYRALYERTRVQRAGAPASFDLIPCASTVVPIGELSSWATYILYGPMLVLLAVIWLCADWTSS